MINNYRSISDDDHIISKMGYRQDLHRGLNAFMNFAFGYTEVGVLVGICSIYDYGLSTGGPSGLIWGWVAAFLLTMVVSFSLAEICSAYPTAGSVYHWSGQLVPAKWTPLASYVCGWTNFLGNAVGDASFAYAWANFVNASMIASGATESFTTNQLVCMSIFVLFIWSMMNCLRIDQLGWLNAAAAVIQCVSTLLIMFLILHCSQSLSSEEFVFTAYYNTTGFTSPSYVYAISLLSALWSFSGYEASAHMAQETNSSRTSAPMGIVWTCFASGIGGLGIIISLLFATDSIEVLLNGRTGNAAIEVFLRTTGPTVGAALAWLIVVNVFFAGLSSVAITSRITYALSRDGAFPFSEHLATVHPTLKSPIVAIAFVWFLSSSLQLLALFSEVAFLSITATSTIGFQVSYAIPITLNLLFDETDFSSIPMTLGLWSKPFGVISAIWLLGTSTLFLLPNNSVVTLETMNYSGFIVGFFATVGVFHWVYHARFTFTGPKRSLEHVSNKLKTSSAAMDI